MFGCLPPVFRASSCAVVLLLCANPRLRVKAGKIDPFLKGKSPSLVIFLARKGVLATSSQVRGYIEVSIHMLKP